MSFSNRIKEYVERRQKILNGGVNCIPSKFPRFSKIFPGIEQKTYYLLTANSKIGKSKFTDFFYLYMPLFYAYKNKQKVRLKIFYFSLEMSKEEKLDEFVCFLLYILSGFKIEIDSKDLNSISEDNPLSEEIINILKSEEYQDIFKFFEENVYIYEDIRNPTGIWREMVEYAENNGTFTRKTIKWTDKVTKKITDKEVNDTYYMNDPDEYRIVITDHIGLLTTEGSMSKAETILKYSSDYCIDLRNKYRYTIVNVQQQSQAQESLENMKANRVKPSLDGLGDCKLTQRDANVIIGLYSPFRYSIPSYEGYNIQEWRDSIRFIEILGGRNGGAGAICPLYFNGATNYFEEMPPPTELDELIKLKKRCLLK